MRKLLLAASCVGAVALSALLAPSAAQARDYPYCLQGDYYGGSLGDCSYDSYEQCLASASGRLAYCDVNPFYYRAEAPVSPYPARKKHHRH